MTWRTGSALSIAAVLAACGSADGQSATSHPGALRARSISGADLGFVYASEPVWQFAVRGGTGSVALPMVMLKEQPAGAAGPVLVWRAMQSGSALECARYYQSADCSGAATIGPSQ